MLENDVDFKEPQNATGAYKQSTIVKVDDLVATKTVTRDYFMNGSSGPAKIE